MRYVCLGSDDLSPIVGLGPVALVSKPILSHFPTLALRLRTGYGRQFLQLKNFLSQQSFADKIEIVGIKDAAITGNFEVMIGDEKQLVHSKRTAGQGRAESPQERDMICEFIQEYLDDNL